MSAYLAVGPEIATAYGLAMTTLEIFRCKLQRYSIKICHSERSVGISGVGEEWQQNGCLALYKIILNFQLSISTEE